MTPEDAINAFKKQYPITVEIPCTVNVKENKVNYQKISALIFRLDKNGEIEMSLEAYDRSGHSVTIVKPERVELTKK